MLSYSFDNSKNTPLYEQLYAFIKSDISCGLLLPKTKLPSKRAFAANLGISTITVENAYAQLLSEGYIYSLPKKGYYVAELSIINDHVTETGHGYSQIIPACNKTEPYYADFSSNQIRPENFPFSVWAKLMRELLSDQDHELMTRSPAGGIYGLRAAIADHLQQFRGMHLIPDQIIIGAGTEYLYGLLIQLLGFDKTYAIENPGYEKIAEIYKSYRVKNHFIDMDQDGIQIDLLEKSGAEVVHISPSHHFPTGIITPASRRYDLLKWAYRSDSRYIIEDDYDSEFRLTGKPIPALQSIDAGEKVIYINTFSKTLTSTMRISYMVLPVSLVERFHKEMGFYSCTVSNFEQYALMRFIERGYFEKHINRMRNHYHKQRDRLLLAIKKSPLSSRATITEEDAGLHFLMKIDTDIPDDEIIERARQKGIRLNCLQNYYVHDQREAEHIFIINYSYIEPDRIEEAIDRIYRCIT